MIWTNSGISLMLVLIFFFGCLIGTLATVLWRSFGTVNESHIPQEVWRFRLQALEHREEQLQKRLKHKDLIIAQLKKNNISYSDVDGI